MKYSLILFFVLFAINNLLHYISEKVIIVIFIVFLYFLMKFLSTAINNEFKTKIDYILNDINMYMNVVFNFLYINKLFYLNLKSLRENFMHLNSILVKKINKLNMSSLLYKSLKSREGVVFFK
jgi:uncharacterized membrane protein